MIIKDDALKPYYIKVTNEEYALCEDVQYNKGKRSRVIGHYTSISGALKRVIRLRVLQSNDETTLEQYIAIIRAEQSRLHALAKKLDL